MYNYAYTCRSSFELQSLLEHNQNSNDQAAKERRTRYQEEEEPLHGNGGIVYT